MMTKKGRTLRYAASREPPFAWVRVLAASER